MFTLYNKNNQYISSTENWGRAIRHALTYSLDLKTVVTIKDDIETELLIFNSGALVNDNKLIKHIYRILCIGKPIIRRSLKKALQDMKSISTCECEDFTAVLYDVTDDNYMCVYKDGEIQ